MAAERSYKRELVIKMIRIRAQGIRRVRDWCWLKLQFCHDCGRQKGPRARVHKSKGEAGGLVRFGHPVVGEDEDGEGNCRLEIQDTGLRGDKFRIEIAALRSDWPA